MERPISELLFTAAVEEGALWLVIDGMVYDLTQFNEHPGGYQVLAELAGGDATEEFREACHPRYAEELMRDFCIGKFTHLSAELSASPASELRHINLAELDIQSQSVWVALDGRVYDLTDNQLLPPCLKDLLSFQGTVVPSIGPFRPAVRKLLDSLCIGELETGLRVSQRVLFEHGVESSDPWFSLSSKVFRLDGVKCVPELYSFFSQYAGSNFDNSHELFPDLARHAKQLTSAYVGFLEQERLMYRKPSLLALIGFALVVLASWLISCINPKMVETSLSREYRLALCGAASVGKTSLCMKFVQDRFNSDYVPTVEDHFRKVIQIESRPYMIEIIDTAGTIDDPAQLNSVISESDGFMLVFDLTNVQSFAEIVNYRDRVLDVNSTRRVSRVPILLVGNKADLKSKRTVPVEEIEKLAKSWGCTFMEASAKTAFNIDASFIELVKLMDRSRRPPDAEKSCCVLV